MRIRNYIFGAMIGLSLVLTPLKTFVSKNNYKEIDLNSKKAEFNSNLDKERENYWNPFFNIQEKPIKIPELNEETDCLGENIINNFYQNKINKNSKNLLNKTIDFAVGEFEYEKKIRKEHGDLCNLIVEWTARKNENWAREKDSLNLLRGYPENYSYIVPGKEKYSLENLTYKEEVVEFQKKLKWFGSDIANSNENVYDAKREKELRKFGLKPMDCITYILKSLSRASGKNYMLRSYSDAQGLSKKLNGFEGIYVAQNTIKTDSQYFYTNGSDEKNLTADYLKLIKNKRYPFHIDYLVTDSLFESSAFKEFLNSVEGFVFFQEGHHTGFLKRGQVIGAHRNSDPLKNAVFYTQDLISVMNNDDPKSDYQSAVLYVPKGSVKNFLAKNYKEIQKIENIKSVISLEEYETLKTEYAGKQKIPFNIW